MVIELFVGPMADQFAAWCPYFPGVVAFSHDSNRAMNFVRIGCQTLLTMKRLKNPSLPHPDLVEWVARVGIPPSTFEAVYRNAIESSGIACA